VTDTFKRFLAAVVFSALGTVILIPIVGYLFNGVFELTLADLKYFVAFMAAIYFNRWLEQRSKRNRSGLQQ
jgi:hypothetical protein